MDFKQAGDLIYVVGETKNELGGSTYLDTKLHRQQRAESGTCQAKELMEKLAQASEKGWSKPAMIAAKAASG